MNRELKATERGFPRVTDAGVTGRRNRTVFDSVLID